MHAQQRPVITAQPQSQTVCPGTFVTLSVTATGTAPLRYTWLKNRVVISGATSAALTFPSVQSSDAGTYRVTVRNNWGTVASAEAVLQVVASPPSIVSQPQSQTVTTGANVTFAVSATGCATLQYQWRKNGVPISGATSASLVLSNVQLSSAGAYSVAITNPGGSTTSASANLTVNPPPNTPPTISNILDQTTNEETATAAIAFTVNDAETAAGSLNVTATSSNQSLIPNSGISLSGSGGNRSLIATPALNATGSTTITVTVSDGAATASDTFVLTVNPLNDAPVAANDSYSVAEDTTLTVAAPGVLANDPDADSPALSAVLVAGPSNGTLTLNANGSFAYTPNANYSGPDSFSYRASDGSLQSGVATVSITINAVNDLPTITDIASQTVNENTATGAIALTVGDVETVAGSLTLSATSSNPSLTPNSGIVFGGTGANRNVTVTSAANQSGTATITVTITDGNGGTASDSFLLTVNPLPTLTINDVTVTEGDSGTVNAIFTVTLSSASGQTVTVNFTTADGIATAPSDYTANSGTLTFAPSETTKTITVQVSGDTTVEANESFLVNLTVPVNATIADSQGVGTINNDDVPPNTAPIAVNDAYSATEDSTLNVAAPGVLSNDTDADSPALTAVLVTAPANGALTLNANGSFTYTPNANFNGPDSFTYRASDGSLQSGIATVTITVNAVNDAPTLTSVNPLTGATEDSAFTITYTALAAVANEADADGDTLSFRVEAVSSGTLTKGGTAVTPGSTLLSSAESLLWTPAANANGTLNAFTIKAHDGTTASSTAVQVQVSAAAVNDAPAGTDRTITINEDTSYSFTAADFGFSDANDSPANAFQAVKIMSSPSAGTLTANGTAVNAGEIVSLDTAPAGATWMARESNREWRTVASSGDGTKLVVGVLNGQIYTSSDSGVSWTPRETNRAWQAVTSSSDGIKLAAAVNGGQIYTSADSGVTWTARDSNREWWSLASSADGTKLVAVVANGQIYTSVDSGVTWAPRESSRTWQAVASSSDGTKLVAVPFNEQIYTSTDSGLTWTARDSGRPWRSVASSADGTKLVAVTYGQIYVSTDSGVNWTSRESSREWYCVASSADGNKLVAGVPGGQIFTSTDAGMNWTARDGIRTWISVASSLDGDRLVAVTQGGRIYTSSGVSGLVFTPATYASGSPYTTFTLQVQDDGGTANGGLNLDQTPNTITVNVTPKPTLSVSDASVTEGNSGTVNATFTVTLSAASSQTVTVNFSTADGTATAGSDYTSTSGTLTFAPNETSKTITVQVSGDTTVEASETVFVNLTDPTNSTIADGQGQGTILNEDETPTSTNRPPVALDDSYTAQQNGSLVGTGLLANDSDPDGDPISAVLVTGPTNGRLIFHIDGTFLYFPNVGFVGPDSFSYKASDGRLQSGVVTVTVTVTSGSGSASGSYAFSTLAGVASRGFWDGAGNVARFSGPSGVAVDSRGNLYVADSGNVTIRKITTDGIVSTYAGQVKNSGNEDGASSTARFDGTIDVAVDGEGAAYVTGVNSIRKITLNGVVSTVTVVADIPRVNPGATGLAVDGVGNIYVADAYNRTIRKITPTGVVSTLAGTQGGFGSADGSGSAASFAQPLDVTVDEAGIVYVADAQNNAIRKITADGVVTTLAGLGLQLTGGGWQENAGFSDGTGSEARFNWPIGVSVDSSGNIYVADHHNSTIRKVTTGGVVSTLAGLPGSWGSADGTGSNARFRDLWRVAVDAAGNVYAADSGNNTIRKIAPNGVVTTVAGVAGVGSADGTGTAARFSGPGGLVTDGVGNIYATDAGNSTIRKITPSGSVSTFAGLAESVGISDGNGSAARFNSPWGIAVDFEGNVFVADSGNHTIRKISASGLVSTVAGMAGQAGNVDGSGSTARFNFPFGVALNSAGNLFVSDVQNHTIRMVTPNGTVSTFAGVAGSAGSADGTATSARFNSPLGIALDNSGDVYVADSQNSTIRKISSVGTVSTFAGLAGIIGESDGTGSSARFYNPRSVALDASGNVYVADSGSHVIRKITSAGVVTRVAGQPGNPGSMDGVGGSVSFTSPSGVAVDSQGNLYVADSGNNTIRKGVPSGSGSPNMPVEVLIANRISTTKTVALGEDLRLPIGDSASPPVLQAARYDGAVRLSVSTAGGKTYLLEYKNSLTESAWKPLSTVTGDGTVKVLTDSSAPTAQRFYRVRVE